MSMIATNPEKRNPPDAALLRDVLVETWRPFVRALARQVHHSCHLGEWIAQEELVSVGYLALVVTAARADPERLDSFRAFAHSRCRGAMLDFVREEYLARNAGEVPDLPDERQIPFERAIASGEASRRLKVVLDTLPQQEREVIGLLFEQDLTTREAGKLVGIDESSVRRRRNKALGAIKKVLAA